MAILAEEDKSKRYNIINDTLEYSPIPMFWCTDDAFLMMNQAFCELTGYTREELISKSFDDLSSEFSAQHTLDEIFQNDISRSIKVLTREIYTASGTVVFTEIRLTRFFGETGQKYYFGLLRPATFENRNSSIFKEEKELLDLALKSTRQGVWIWNARANETIYSKDAFAIIDYDETDLLPNGDDWSEILHPDEAETTMAYWNGFVAGDEDFFCDEFRLKKKNGDFIWIRSLGRVTARDSQGNPMRVAGIMADINDAKINELKIKEQTQQLLNYAFFNSHQLRGPISSILGIVELLKHEYNAEYVNMLERVVGNLDDAVKEINQLLWGKSTTNHNLVRENDLKRVTLVDSDSRMNIIYKKSIEKFSGLIDASSPQSVSSKTLDMLLKKELETDLVLIDADDKDIDLWYFLNQYDKLRSKPPIYLLTQNIQFANAIKASEFSCVSGFLVKPLNMNDILSIIKRSAN